MYARGMTFGEFVAHYRSPALRGLLLRYLSDAWRALRQTVPEASRTTELADLIAWLGEVVRLVDSSLLDEWTTLAGLMGEPTASGDDAPPPRPGRSRATSARSGCSSATPCGGAWSSWPTTISTPSPPSRPASRSS